MKKSALKCIVSILVLLLLLLGLYHYTRNVINNFTEISTPKILQVAYAENTVTFSWSKVEYATSYRIYSRLTGGDWKLVKLLGNDEFSYSADQGAQASQYSVRACYVTPIKEKALLSDYSHPVNKVNIESLDAPVIIDTAYEDNTITFSWNAVEYATSYRIYSRSTGGDWELVKLLGNNEFSYSADQGAQASQYSVRACYVSPIEEKALLSDYSQPVNNVHIESLDAPVIVDTVCEGNTITFSWNAVDYVTSYRIYSRPMGGSWSLIKAVGRNECSYSEETSQATLQYAVRACYVMGDTTVLSPYSNVVELKNEENGAVPNGEENQ